MWQAYQEQGVRVWGISANDPIETLENFREQLGITFPILFDENGTTTTLYNFLDRQVESALHPQDWIIAPDGSVAYVNQVYEPDEMQAVIDDLLEEAR